MPDRAQFYQVAADAVLVAHTLFVAFMILGLIAIYLGHWLAWRWVRGYVFRLLHLLGIALVVLQSWLGVICPLTTWEMQLRRMAGAASYEGSFIQHWLQAVLYYEAPDWVFVLAYTAFGMLVVASWLLVPPGRDADSESTERP